VGCPKLTGFHCHCRKTFDKANITPDPEVADTTMGLEDNDSLPPLLLSTNKRKSHDKNQMDTESEHTNTPTTKTLIEQEDTMMQDATVSTPKPMSNIRSTTNAWTTIRAGGKPAQPTKKMHSPNQTAR
jgi:hypothetical protein